MGSEKFDFAKEAQTAIDTVPDADKVVYVDVQEFSKNPVVENLVGTEEMLDAARTNIDRIKEGAAIRARNGGSQAIELKDGTRVLFYNSDTTVLEDVVRLSHPNFDVEGARAFSFDHELMHLVVEGGLDNDYMAEHLSDSYATVRSIQRNPDSDIGQTMMELRAKHATEYSATVASTYATTEPMDMVLQDRAEYAGYADLDPVQTVELADEYAFKHAPRPADIKAIKEVYHDVTPNTPNTYFEIAERSLQTDRPAAAYHGQKAARPYLQAVVDDPVRGPKARELLDKMDEHAKQLKLGKEFHNRYGGAPIDMEQFVDPNAPHYADMDTLRPPPTPDGPPSSRPHPSTLPPAPVKRGMSMVDAPTMPPQHVDINAPTMPPQRIDVDGPTMPPSPHSASGPQVPREAPSLPEPNVVRRGPTQSPAIFPRPVGQQRGILPDGAGGPVRDTLVPPTLGSSGVGAPATAEALPEPVAPEPLSVLDEAPPESSVRPISSRQEVGDGPVSSLPEPGEPTARQPVGYEREIDPVSGPKETVRAVEGYPQPYDAPDTPPPSTVEAPTLPEGVPADVGPEPTMRAPAEYPQDVLMSAEPEPMSSMPAESTPPVRESVMPPTQRSAGVDVPASEVLRDTGITAEDIDDFTDRLDEHFERIQDTDTEWISSDHLEEIPESSVSSGPHSEYETISSDHLEEVPESSARSGPQSEYEIISSEHLEEIPESIADSDVHSIPPKPKQSPVSVDPYADAEWIPDWEVKAEPPPPPRPPGAVDVDVDIDAPKAPDIDVPSGSGHAVAEAAEDAAKSAKRLGKNAGVIGGVLIGAGVSAYTLAVTGDTEEAGKAFYETAVPYGETQLDVLSGDTEAAKRSAFVETWSNVGGWVAGVGASVAAGAILGGAGGGTAGSVVPGAGNVAGAVGGVVIGAGVGLVGGLTGANVAEYVYDNEEILSTIATEEGASRFLDGYKDLPEDIASTASDAWEWTGEQASAAGKWTGEQADAAGNWVDEKATQASAAVSREVEEVGAAASEGYQQASKWVGEKADSAKSWASETADSVGSAVSGVGDSISRWWNDEDEPKEKSPEKQHIDELKRARNDAAASGNHAGVSQADSMISEASQEYGFNMEEEHGGMSSFSMEEEHGGTSSYEGGMSSSAGYEDSDAMCSMPEESKPKASGGFSGPGR